jgi:hypothetical protein
MTFYPQKINILNHQEVTIYSDLQRIHEESKKNGIQV